MMRKEHIAFGVKALAIGLGAKGNRCNDRQKIELAEAVMEIADDRDAVAAVHAFLRYSRIDLVEAGNVLVDFLQSWRRDQDLFEWQRGVDING